MRRNATVFVGYVALTVALTYPLSFHAADHVMSHGTDTNLFIWTIAWDVHAFVHHPLSIFDANIFYPFRDTLAFSENLIGSAAFGAPVIWVTHNPVLAMNVAALVTVPLCALGAFVLARRVGIGTAGAVIAGLVYGFSPPRFFRLDQLHLTSVEWIPFSLAYASTYATGGRARDLRIAIAFFVMQALTSGHGAVFLALALGALALYRLALGEPLRLTKRLHDAGVVGALLFIPVVLVALPYRRAQVDMGLRRTLANWHVPWTSFAAAPTHVDTWLSLQLFPHVDVFGTAGAYLFPGVLTLAFAVAAIVWRPEPGVGWRRAAVVLDAVFAVELVAAIYGSVASDPRLRIAGVVVASARHVWRPWLLCVAAAAGRMAVASRVPLGTVPRVRCDMPLFYTLLLVASLALSVGPPYGVWQYVYWLPGLNFIRAPSRFTILGVLALGVLAGFGFDWVTIRCRPAWRAAIGWIVAALFVAEFAAMPLPMTYQNPETPAIDRWLAAQPQGFVVAEVPVPDSNGITVREEQESIYALHATAHWQKTVHGYSGLLPDFSDDLFRGLAHFPDKSTIERLRGIGVTRVVVHDPGIEARIRAFRELTFEHRERDGAVYALH